MTAMRTRTIVLSVLAVIGILTFGHAQAAAQAASTQIVFSATAEPSDFCTISCSGPPEFGFWIWCEAPGANPYATSQGNCSGSMYFYNIEPFAEQVTGTVSLVGTTATMTVGSSTTAPMFIACTLTNLTSPPSPGPTNRVSVTCTNTSAKPGPNGTSITRSDALVTIVALRH